MKRIHLISTPRNLSTAIMYSFAQRKDTRVVDEPLYAAYLMSSGAEHPGREEILNAYDTDPQQVITATFQKGEGQHDVLFVKNMTHHLTGLDLHFLEEVTNILYIRNPKQVLTSYAKVIANPVSEDIGIKEQADLFRFLCKKNRKPIVLDSGELLKNPEKVLSELCVACGVHFDSNMLQWEAGPRPEDGIWAKYWYANVHQSTGFVPQKSSSSPLPEYLEPLYQELKPYYELLFQHSIKSS